MKEEPRGLPSTVNDRVLREIGLLVVEWGMFAYRMELLIWWLLGVKSDEDGRAVTTHLNDRLRLELIGTLALERIKDTDLRRKLLKKLKALATLVSDRNEVIHGFWYGAGGKHKTPTTWQKVKARQGVKIWRRTQEIRETVEHLDGIIVRSDDLAADLRDFLADHAGLP